MEQRLNIEKILPLSWPAMYSLSGSTKETGLTRIQKHLIAIRASQINACAFCLDIHTKEALKNGETPQRIFLLSGWRESTLFSKEERALLAITEEVTLISNAGVSDETFETGLKLFGEELLAAIIMTAVTINSWNRIALSSRLS